MKVIRTYNGYDLDGTVDKLINELTELKKIYPDKELHIDFSMKQIAYTEDEETEIKIYYND